jgi:hypothetical protein
VLATATTSTTSSNKQQHHDDRVSQHQQAARNNQGTKQRGNNSDLNVGRLPTKKQFGEFHPHHGKMVEDMLTFNKISPTSFCQQMSCSHA